MRHDRERDLVVEEGIQLLEYVDHDEDGDKEEKARDEGCELLSDEVAVEELHAAGTRRVRRLGRRMISAAWSVRKSPIAPMTMLGVHIATAGSKKRRSASSSPPARQR